MKTLMAVLIAAVFIGQQDPNQRDQPSNPQKLVSPDEYRGIPKEVRDFLDLEQQHCQLPERPNYEDKIKINVVSGHFAKAEQTDWAALCLVKDQARVVVLWGGKTGCGAEIRSAGRFRAPSQRSPPAVYF